MCGIAGIYQFNDQEIELKTLIRFTDSMLHRGPDGSGYELLNNNNLGLGQRRLSILDLSESGKQPMSYADGRYWITYNGEIFNFEDIKSELSLKGHSFLSNTDTEVILASYYEWGKDCLNKFNGMWAFAIWDNLENELFLARDRFGVKPLYYTHEEGKRFAFASETRAFKYLDGFERKFNSELLNYNIDDPYALEGLGYTIFDGIFQLLPSHYILIKNNQLVEQKRWWHIEDHLHKVPITFEEQSDQFYKILKDACRIRLVSDVPIATALSGGLDSTAVYSTVFSILQNETLARVDKDSQKAFTATFNGLPQDERLYAGKAAEYTGGEIIYIENDVSNLIQQIEFETELSDFINVAPITSISDVYKGMRKNGIVVSLDGHGVDEMLYGYRDMVWALYNESLWNGKISETYKMQEILSKMYHPEQWDGIQVKLEQYLNNKKKRELNPLFRIKKFFKKPLSNREFLPLPLPSLSDKPYDFTNLPNNERMLYFEFFQHTLPALLRNFDRAGMMNSIEIRMPFLDWRLVVFVFSLPFDSKIGNNFTKRILREAMKGKMEESLRTRTYKVGIGSPIDYWCNGHLKDWVFDHIKDQHIKKEAEESISKNGNINPQVVRKLWQNINIDLIK